jgi:hypothetical protein
MALAAQENKRKTFFVWVFADIHSINFYYADCREEAEKRFQEISRAYESLMTTDEDIKVEQLGF